MSRMMGYLISPTVSANNGTGPTLIIWGTAGLSGMEAPAIRASRGLQMPLVITTVSVSISPLSGRPRRLSGRGHGEGTHRPPLLALQRPAAQGVDGADARRAEPPKDDLFVDEG